MQISPPSSNPSSSSSFRITCSESLLSCESEAKKSLSDAPRVVGNCKIYDGTDYRGGEKTDALTGYLHICADVYIILFEIKIQLRYYL